MAIPIATALAPILSALAVGIVVRVLLAIGFSVVSFVGISNVWDQLTAAIWSNLGGTSASILTILGMARVDDGIQVVLSAAAAVLIWRGLTAPIIKRLLFIGN